MVLLEKEPATNECELDLHGCHFETRMQMQDNVGASTVEAEEWGQALIHRVFLMMKLSRGVPKKKYCQYLVSTNRRSHLSRRHGDISCTAIQPEFNWVADNDVHRSVKM